jgi:hypothetical protein
LLWTRRTGVSSESCGANLGEFVNSVCGDVNVAFSNTAASYSIGRANWPTGTTQFMNVYQTGGVDTDDSYIVTHDVSLDLLPDNLVLNRPPVTSVCDLDGANCDTADVHFYVMFDDLISGAGCRSGDTFLPNYGGGAGTYGGMYYYCHTITNPAPDTGGAHVGSKQNYNEIKL